MKCTDCMNEYRCDWNREGCALAGMQEERDIPCTHDKDGVCDMLSDAEVQQPCIMSACPMDEN